MKPFFSIYPSCKNTDGIIESGEEDETETVVVDLGDEDAYWCDKKKNRSSECQNWVTPEEQALIDAYIAEKKRIFEEKQRLNLGEPEAVIEALDLDAPIILEFWKQKAAKELASME